MNTFAIAWRELKRYFRSPSSYIILAMFLLYQGLVFFVLLDVLNRPDVPRGAPMRWFFGGVIWFYPIFVFLVAMLTAGTLASEQRSRSIETLMTAPVREFEVVLGKFIGAFGFFIFMWAWTFFYVVTLHLVAKSQTVSTGPLMASYLGCLLIGSVGLAFGVFCSSLTKDDLLAGLVTAIGLLMIFILKLMLIWDILKADDKSSKFLGILSFEALHAIVERIMIIDYMEDFSRGIVDTRWVIFPVTATVFCLFAATRILQLRKWR